MILPRNGSSTTFRVPTANFIDSSFYVLFTGFPASINVANITIAATVEFVPASTFQGICNVEYADLGCASDEVANDMLSKYEVLAIATLQTA